MPAPSFEADSPIAGRVAPSLGYRRGLYEPRTRPPVAWIVHTTGGGPVKKWREKPGKYAAPFDAALAIYGGMMTAGPHYVIGQDPGQVAQVCPESLCAWGVGGAGGGAYKRPQRRWLTSDTEWWRRAWAGLDSPRQLAGGHLWDPYSRATGVRVALSSLAGSVNANTLHVEVVPEADDLRGPWSRHAWASLVMLILESRTRHDSLEMTRERIIRHSDAHPLARSAHNAPWDTVDAQFTWQLFVAHSGVPLSCGPN